MSSFSVPCRIFVRIHVLAEQLNFGVAEIGHLAGFGEDRVGSAAAFFSAGEGDDAVGAEFVAAFDDGDVSAMRIGAGGEFGFEAFVGFAIVEAGDADEVRGFWLPASGVRCLRLDGFQLHQHLRQVAIGGRSADQRDVRGALENLFAFLLRNATEDSELLALL